MKHASECSKNLKLIKTPEKYPEVPQVQNSLQVAILFTKKHPTAYLNCYYSLLSMIRTLVMYYKYN